MAARQPTQSALQLCRSELGSPLGDKNAAQKRHFVQFQIALNPCTAPWPLPFVLELTLSLRGLSLPEYLPLLVRHRLHPR